MSIQSNFSNQSSAYNTTHLSNKNANRLQSSFVLHNQNIAYNTTYPSNESANRLQASSVLHNQNSYCSNQNTSNNSKHQPVMARNFVISEEQQYSNLSQSATMSMDDIPDSYSSTSYDITGN
ncbi:hypothetical protein F8M41_002167 [Gigaspora margarita]|uniref:Uncharacterized protein n=1 Tax=Gigaspora margarita TaxID=4874 RepID=A0A8H3XE01_GIGMA|nr:hypothetical protein F8M41_002167 [Gigaspora margarita]